MDDLDISISLAFGRLLQKNGIRQKEAASVMELAESGLSKIKNANQNLTFRHIYLFCKRFKIDVAEVVKLVEEISINKELLDSFRQSKETKKHFEKINKNLIESVR